MKEEKRMRSVVCLGKHQSHLFIGVKEWAEINSPPTFKNLAFKVKSKRMPSLHQNKNYSGEIKVGGNIQMFCNKCLFYNNPSHIVKDKKN